MRVQKGDKVVIIPAWLLFVGAIVVDSMATNLIRLNALKSMSRK